MIDDLLEESKVPLPNLPIFGQRALMSPGPGDVFSEFQKGNALWRFIFGNMKYTEEELQQVGAFAVALITGQANTPFFMALIQIYFLGVMDGVRTQMAQAEIDQKRVEKGSVN